MLSLLARFLLGMAVFLVLQRLLPLRRGVGAPRPGWASDALSFVGNALLWVALYKVWLRFVPDAFGSLRPLVPLLSVRGLPVALQVVATLALESFVYYWGHRLLHYWPPLWRFHAVHHSARHLDWFGGWRGHVFETVYFTAFTSFAMTLLDVGPPTVLAFTVYRFFEGQVEHSNVRLPLGPLRWVLPSPWFHHWHHASDREAWNRNFSPYPVWDVLFGTAYMPGDRLPSGFGVEDPVPDDYPGQVAYPLGLVGTVRRVERWLEAHLPMPGARAD